MGVYLNIKNPIRLPDLGVWPAQEIAKEANFNENEMRKVSQAKDLQGQYREVQRILKQKGFDGIVYRNEVEDVGSDSWIAFNQNQIRIIED
jgi:hypothetical protein